MAVVAVAVVRAAVMAVVVGHGIARRCAPLFTQRVFLVVAAVVTLVVVGWWWWWWRCYVVVAWASAVAFAVVVMAAEEEAPVAAGHCTGRRRTQPLARTG